ncbi:MAG: hypothetical protein PSV24_06080 [Rhodoferax sp.]|nr:hypothetical protein [Rhodoferax sp.]
MNSTIEACDRNGQKLTIEVSVDLRTARDLRSLLLNAAYARNNNGGTYLALLFKCGFTPARLASEIGAFKGVVRPEVAHRLQVAAIDHPEQLDDVLRGQVVASQWHELRERIEQASGGSPTASSREDVQFLLLRRWLHGLGPIKTAELAAQCGASAPTVAAAIKALAPQDVLRTRDRQVALQGFAPDSWQKWLGKSAQAPSVKFVDRSGAPRSPQKLANKLSALARPDVAIGGVLGAMRHYPGIDITGAPRLDLMIHGTSHADLSFIAQLDPALMRDDSAEGHAHVVVHFTQRRKSYFDVLDGYVWADVLDCLVHLWQAGLTHQALDLISHLTAQTTQPKEKKWTTP